VAAPRADEVAVKPEHQLEIVSLDAVRTPFVLHGTGFPVLVSVGIRALGLPPQLVIHTPDTVHGKGVTSIKRFLYNQSLH